MGRVRTTREAWVEAGLQALAGGGIAAVRVELLAKNLGVTKGGFYGSFADRDALLEAMLDAWERESVDDVLEDVARDGDFRMRVRRAGQLTFSDDRLLPIDLAVRSWARDDPRAAERLRRVDNRRIALLREALGPEFTDPAELEARSLLAFCVAIGRHFVAADHGDQSREEVFARAADIVFTHGARRAGGSSSRGGD